MGYFRENQEYGEKRTERGDRQKQIEDLKRFKEVLKGREGTDFTPEQVNNIESLKKELLDDASESEGTDTPKQKLLKKTYGTDGGRTR